MGVLAFMGDWIKRSSRSKDIRDEKKDVTWLVSSTTINYRTEYTRFAK